jgi:hypothetical protein
MLGTMGCVRPRNPRQREVHTVDIARVVARSRTIVCPLVLRSLPVDADRFDTLARILQTTPNRRLSLRALTALGLAALLGEDEAEAKKKGRKKGRKKKGGKKKDVKCQGESCEKEEEKQFCHPAGQQCILSPYPCCAGTVCCDGVPPYNSGFCALATSECCKQEAADCMRSNECCPGLCCSSEGQCIVNLYGGSEICSTDESIECCEGYTCQDRNPSGFGTCQPG